MTRLILWIAAHPRSMLSVIVLVSMAAASQLGGLRFELSTAGMMRLDDPAATFHRQMQATFGADSVVIAVVADPALFDPEKLAAMRTAVEAIAALPLVGRTESLFSVPHLKSVDGLVSAAPYLTEPPLTGTAVDMLRASARVNPFVAGRLLSDDGQAMAINVYVGPDDGLPGFDARVTRGIAQALAPLADVVQDAYQIGPHYVRGEILDGIHADQLSVLPVAVVVLFATLALTLRSPAGVVLPALSAGLSVLWTLGLMAALQVPLNLMTVIVPVLLIVIGSTEDIHLIAEYQAAVGRGLARDEAIAYMAQSMGLTVLLTFTTTCLGFLSIALSDVAMLRQFGLVAAGGLAINFLLTLCLVPIGLGWLGRTAGERRILDKARPRWPAFVAGVYRRPAWRAVILAVSLGVTLLFGYGALRLQVSNAPLDYFDAGSPVMARVMDLQQRFGGEQTFSIVVRSGIEGTFLKTRYLGELRELQQFLAGVEGIDASLSLADYVGLVHRVMEERIDGRLTLPEEDDVVREYLYLGGHERVRALVSPDYAAARILVRHRLRESAALDRALTELRDFAQRQVDPALEVRVTGEAILTQRAAEALGRAQGQSLAVMVLVIFGVIAVLFLDARAGLVAVLPNLLPIAVLFGVMGLGGIGLNTATALVAAIALGICVDHTIHFMVRYHGRSRASGDETAALTETIGAEWLPILSASLALALGFGALALSVFPPVARFGGLSAMVMGLALLATFLVTPALLASLHLITLWDLLAVRLGTGFTTHCPLFEGMRTWQIRKIVLVSQVRAYRAAEAMVRQGEAGDEMFVLLDGGAEVRLRGGDGTERTVRRLSSGDVFGEIALVSRVARTADVIALEDTQVLVFRWQGLARIARLFPRIAARLYRNLAAILGARLAEAG